MATRSYSVLTDSTPAEWLEDLNNQTDALNAALAYNKPVFVQQYVNGRVGQSWTPSELKAKLTK